jgi:hypothetical protein
MAQKSGEETLEIKPAAAEPAKPPARTRARAGGPPSSSSPELELVRKVAAAFAIVLLVLAAVAAVFLVVLSLFVLVEIAP